MKKNITGDLSKLTSIPEDIIQKFSNLYKYCISEAIYESKLNNDGITEIDLGFGTLICKAELGNIKMKIIPSSDLEKDIKDVSNGKLPALSKKLEKNLNIKLVELFKDLI